MTGNNHRLFGAGMAAILAAFIAPLHGPVTAGAVIAASIPGATAPDWLECRFMGRTLIPHRTITHVLVLWLMLLVFGFYIATESLVIGALLTGFSIGGISHWIGDVGTPMGVPVWHPTRRTTFRLWRTGTSEVFPVLAVWAIAALIYFSSSLFSTTA